MPVEERRVAFGDAHEVVLVHGEVPDGRRESLEPLPPLGSARQRFDRGRVRLVHPVVHDGECGAGGLERARRGGLLALVEHGPEGEDGAPVELGLAGADRHDTVAELLCHLQPSRPVGGHQDRYVDRPRRQETGRGDHAHDGPVHLDLLAAEQGAQLAQILLDRRPRQRLLAEGHATGEAGAEGGDGPAGREALEGRDRRRLHEHVAKAGDEDRGTESDALGALGDARQRDPHVGVQRRRVVQPGPFVAERLGHHRVLDHLGPGRKRAGDVHGVTCPPARDGAARAPSGRGSAPGRGRS